MDAIRRARAAERRLSRVRRIRAALRVIRTTFVRYNTYMIRKLVKTGNSVALILSKDMRDHLALGDEVEVEYLKGEIRLRKPMTVHEATEYSLKRYSKAYKKLAE